MSSPAPFLPLVGYPATFHAGLDFYFSLGTLVVGIVGGIYLFAEWWLHRYTSLLFWSLGFFAIYWFQVPAILANAGFSFVVTSFNLFYAVSFPLGFFGLVLIYLGIRTILPPANPGMARRLILVWLLACLVAFATFFSLGSAITNHLPAFIITFLFFVPIHVLILSSLWRWHREWRDRVVGAIRAGIITMMGGVLLGFIQDFMILRRVLAYPPQFWFVAIATFRLMFVLQAVGMLALLAGFFIVHYGYAKMVREVSRGGQQPPSVAGGF